MNIKRTVLLAAAIVAFSAQAPAPTASRHLEYAFTTYNVARLKGPVDPIEGPGTGTMSVDVEPAADGGVLVSATEWWWNAVRPEQTRTCEVYSNGGLACGLYPSPTQSEIVLMPLLAAGYFSGGDASWKREYRIDYGDGWALTAASMNLRVDGSAPAGNVERITSRGTIAQLDRHYFTADDDTTISYDKTAAVPVRVHDVRQWTPTGSVFSSRAVDLKLLKDSAGQ